LFYYYFGGIAFQSSIEIQPALEFEDVVALLLIIGTLVILGSIFNFQPQGANDFKFEFHGIALTLLISS
jgi:hypothetical protein